MVESMVALVLVDALMQQKSQCELFDVTETFGGQTDPLVPANPLGKSLKGYGINTSSH
jgi:hypothetical protein